MFFRLPTELYCRKDCVKAHAADIAAFGNKAYIITGKGSSKKNGSLNDVTDVLKSNNIDYIIFDRVEENPSVANIMDAAAAGRDFRPDFIIGIGGGSPLDASKAISLMVRNSEADESLLLTGGSYGYLPVITVPTTCGTGSEITPYSILTLHAQKTKSSIPHKIYPSLALCDPGYLSSAPVSVIRNTAVDALGHLIESYINSKATPVSRMFADTGLSHWNNIAAFIENDSYTDEQYEELLITSSFAGMAISHTGTSLPHRMSYHFTYTRGIPHGKAVGAFLSAYTAHASDRDRTHVLTMLGMGSCEELGELIKRLTGTITMDSKELDGCIDYVLSNKSKLANCPYRVDRDIAADIYVKSLIMQS